MAHSPTLARSQPGDAGRSGEGPPGGATLEKALPGRSSRPHPHAVLSSCPAARFLDLGPSHLEKPRVSGSRRPEASSQSHLPTLFSLPPSLSVQRDSGARALERTDHKPGGFRQQAARAGRAP